MDDLLALVIIGTLLLMAGIGLYKAETASGIFLALAIICVIAYVVVYEY
jgi:uncharacterized membrane protein SirB2